MTDSARLVREDFRLSVEEAYRSVLGSAREVVLIDQPGHRNLGDTFIWQGELDVLRRLGVKIVYRSTGLRIQWDIITRIDPDVPVLFHGGGNMGDTWMHFEEFRRDAVQRLLGRKLILLPQTVHYSDVRVLEESARIFEAADDLTLMTRVSNDVSRLQNDFPGVKVVFCPDSALGMNEGRVPRYSPVRDGVLVVARDDKESRDAPVVARKGDSIGDWEFSWLNKYLWRSAHGLNRAIISRRAPLLLVNAARNLQSEKFRILNMSAARSMFTGVRVVATNRLHVHIYCGLAGIPHFVADNNYGKIGAIYDDYTHRFKDAGWARSLDDAYLSAVRLIG